VDWIPTGSLTEALHDLTTRVNRPVLELKSAAPVLFFRLGCLRPALVLELVALFRSWRDCFASFDHCTATAGHFTAPRPNFDKLTRIRCYLARLESPHKSLLQQGAL